MPYSSEWVDPEIALEYEDVTITHVYDDDDMVNGPMFFWYSVGGTCGMQYCVCDQLEDYGDDEEGCRNVFDVRDLPEWTNNTEPQPLSPYPIYNSYEEIINTIKAAIDSGTITEEGVKEEYRS